MQSSKPRNYVYSVLTLASLGWAGVAVAQQTGTAGAVKLPSVEPGAATPPAAADTVSDDANAAMTAMVARFARFDALKPQGQTTDFSSTFDTLLQDAGGFRSTLADSNLFIRGVSINSIGYDVGGNRRPTSPQLYSGQKPTITSSNDIRAGWKIGGTGTDITQINVGFSYSVVNWDQVGPSGSQFSRFDIYSTFFNRKVEVKAGVSQGILEFIGIFAGGNPILASGLGGTIPVQTGLSGSTAPTPGINVQLNGRDGLYSKTGIMRSIGSDGLISEARDNGVGLKLTRRGAKPLVIQEFGILRPASQNGRQMWLRLGGLYNTTDYTRFDRPGTKDNWSLYALADYQIVKPSTAEPYRGIFIGASALVAPDNVNIYTQTFEGRVYAVGMVPGRPTDQMSFTLSYNRFGKPGRETFDLLGLQTNKGQLSVGALYAFRARAGLYLTPSISYIRKPSFTGDFGPAVNLGGSITTLF